MSSTPQHMPEELLARTPPIMQALIDAGSGPIFAPWGARARFTAAAMTPGCTRTAAPPSRTSTARQCRDTSTRIPSVTAWPDRLVPAARKVTGMRSRWLSRKSPFTSSRDEGRTTPRGTIR